MNAGGAVTPLHNLAISDSQRQGTYKGERKGGRNGGREGGRDRHPQSHFIVPEVKSPLPTELTGQYFVGSK